MIHARHRTVMGEADTFVLRVPSPGPGRRTKPATRMLHVGSGYFLRYVEEKLNGSEFALNDSVLPS